jgi:hypothetical protein
MARGMLWRGLLQRYVQGFWFQGSLKSTCCCGTLNLLGTCVMSIVETTVAVHTSSGAILHHLSLAFWTGQV